MRCRADVDERTLREIYLPGFERVVTQARAVDGDVRLQQGQRHLRLASTTGCSPRCCATSGASTGFVMSDWGAVHDRVRGARRRARPRDAAQPRPAATPRSSRRSRAGELDEAAARPRRSSGCSRLGGPGPAGVRPASRRRTTPTTRWPGEAAEHCIVLLKNDGDLLPLDPPAAQTVAVIGEFARTPRYQGAGSSQVNPTRRRRRRSTSCARRCRTARGDLRPRLPHGRDQELTATRSPTRRSRSPRDADVPCCFLGLPDADESEGFDRDHLDLPAGQLDAARAGSPRSNPTASSSCSRNGSAVLHLRLWQRPRRRVLEGWLLGQAGGGAVADLLLGAVNPSGRLAETIPLRLEDNPSYLNFPGDVAGTCATARASSSATAATTRLDAAGELRRSATACPTRPSSTTTWPSRSAAATPPATWRCG